MKRDQLISASGIWEKVRYARAYSYEGVISHLTGSVSIAIGLKLQASIACGMSLVTLDSAASVVEI